MLKKFRIVSVAEGLSYLAILCVTLGLIDREFVSYLGMLHGLLFIVYLALSFALAEKKGWSILIWLAMFVAAIAPFAFIIVEFFLRKKSVEAELAVEYKG